MMNSLASCPVEFVDFFSVSFFIQALALPTHSPVLLCSGFPWTCSACLIFTLCVGGLTRDCDPLPNLSHCLHVWFVCYEWPCCNIIKGHLVMGQVVIHFLPRFIFSFYCGGRGCCWVLYLQRPEQGLRSLDLERHAAVGHLTWALGIKPWASARAGCALNHGALSPVQSWLCIKNNFMK